VYVIQTKEPKTKKLDWKKTDQLNLFYLCHTTLLGIQKLTLHRGQGNHNYVVANSRLETVVVVDEISCVTKRFGSRTHKKLSGVNFIRNFIRWNYNRAWNLLSRGEHRQNQEYWISCRIPAFFWIRIGFGYLFLKKIGSVRIRIFAWFLQRNFPESDSRCHKWWCCYFV